MFKRLKVNYLLMLVLLLTTGLAIYREYKTDHNVNIKCQEPFTLAAERNVRPQNQTAATNEECNQKNGTGRMESEERRSTKGRRELRLEDIHITIKTTQKYIKKRMQILLDTWITKMKHPIYIITDGMDEDAPTMEQVKWIPTKCGPTHNVTDLCCKTASEYKTFKDNPRKWWCHFDDDMYVNPSRLIFLLSQYEWRDWYYIGRMSRPEPLNTKYEGKLYRHQFATGGAYCVSGSLANEIAERMQLEKFIDMCMTVKYGDDAMMGLIMNGLFDVPITEPLIIHSFPENQSLIEPARFKNDVTFNYVGGDRIVDAISFGKLETRFTVKEDPTRFLSLHCHIYPKDNLCEKKNP